MIECTDWKTKIGMPSLEDMVKLKEILHVCVPLMPQSSIENMHQQITAILKDYAEFFIQLYRNNEIVGFAVLRPIPEAQEGHLLGGVLPSWQGRGGGQLMFAYMNNIAQRYKHENMRSFYFLQDQRTAQFLMQAGFVEKDRIFWSEWNLEASTYPWIEDKYQQLCEQGLSFISGMEFSQKYQNWERMWWRHFMDMIQDIPINQIFVISKIGNVV